jgi:hypothetical protein
VKFLAKLWRWVIVLQYSLAKDDTCRRKKVRIINNFAGKQWSHFIVFPCSYIDRFDIEKTQILFVLTEEAKWVPQFCTSEIKDNRNQCIIFNFVLKEVDKWQLCYGYLLKLFDQFIRSRERYSKLWTTV